jgi:CheY-like chemotaxis protein
VELKELNVLYMENDLDTLDEVLSVVEARFHECYISAAFEESLRLFKDAFIDLLIANLDKPELGNLKFITYIKQKVPAFPVIVLSARDEEAVRQELGKVRVDAILPLPIDLDRLREEISTLEKQVVDFASKRDDRKQEKNPSSSLGVAEAIDGYFSLIASEANSTEGIRPGERRMNYNLMRDFLYTAYNQFRALDSNLENDKLKEARWRLEKGAKLQRAFTRKTSGSIEAIYEDVFLLKQVEYLRLRDEFEALKTRLDQLRGNLGSITSQLESAKESLKLTKNPETKEEQTKLVKQLNSRHVDIVHHISESKERLDTISEEMQRIWEANIDEFKKTFREKSDDLKHELNDLLGLLAYRFDRTLWQRAKGSDAIRNFFAEANVRGVLSSKTFLQYYVANVDVKMAGEKLKKLIKYLQEFTRTNKIPVALIGSDNYEIPRLRTLIEQVDPMLKVHVLTSTDALMRMHEKEPFELIISLYELPGRSNALIFYEQFKARFGQSAQTTSFALALPKSESAIQTKARSLGIRHFFYPEMNAEQVAKKMLDIL